MPRTTEPTSTMLEDARNAAAFYWGHPVTLPIQPPLRMPLHHTLYPFPAVLLTTPPTSPWSPTNDNFVGMACAVRAHAPQLVNGVNGRQDDDHSIASGSEITEQQASDVMSGAVAVSGTPLQDGTGIAFVFRLLSIDQIGEWHIKIVVMKMSSEGGEARCCGEVISRVVRVGPQEERNEIESLSPEEQRFMDSLGN